MIRLSSLGDVLLCAPALRALRRRFPDAPLHFLVAKEFRQAAELLSGIDQIIGIRSEHRMARPVKGCAVCFRGDTS
ncbi:MAG: hypothetical protein IPG71_07075 [bacterium]|nr:hypothetical protein [bacterium]